MEDLNNQKIIAVNSVFDDRFMETKSLYVYHFNVLPSIHLLNNIDGEKAFLAFKEKYTALVVHLYTYRWYEQKCNKYQFYSTVIILSNNCIVEFNKDYCNILHNGIEDHFIDELTALVLKCKERKKRLPQEINLVVRNGNRLDLKVTEIKKPILGLDLFYEDDFKKVDELIRKRLKKKNDKGIVLLHGIPGTGKTTYLRYLIGSIQKRVMFLSPAVAGNLMSPDFIELLLDNPNTVLIIEDAENIIMDRKISNDSSVSNLLNMSDGLMADILNIQLICTFNSPLTMVDEALMRKGRLIAKYEFGKLSVFKSQRLSDHLGFKKMITRPMTVAEISNQHEGEFEKKQAQVMGFRREITIEN